LNTVVGVLTGLLLVGLLEGTLDGTEGLQWVVRGLPVPVLAEFENSAKACFTTSELPIRL